jgi:hypothetical protein
MQRAQCCRRAMGAQARRDGWCAWHDPGRRAEMAEARRRGGQARSNKARARKQLVGAAMSPAELEGVIGLTIAQVLAGTKPPSVGSAVAALARAAIAVREATEIEERLAALEAASEACGQRRA